MPKFHVFFKLHKDTRADLILNLFDVGAKTKSPVQDQSQKTNSFDLIHLIVV